jgi:carboxylate-amine ligase
MSRVEHLRLFEGYGIEMEYMIVDAETLKAAPLTDYVLREANGGEQVNEVAFEEMAWSNELVMHVIELKTNGAARSLPGLAAKFQRDIDRINGLLATKGARLMPTAMHPFFDPESDTRLWQHDDAAIYQAYDRIFGCKGHGWSNLQSVHINLPFFDHGEGGEFGTLHAAIRLVLPLIPGIAASSPIYEGRASGLADSRLEFYRNNQIKVPEITGGVIPEQAFSRAQYDEMVFQKTYRAIAPHDPDKILQEEWLNSRGAIARFDRNAIEIRVMDIQESPRADLAIVSAVVSVVKALTEGRFCDAAAQRRWSSEPLREVFLKCLAKGSEAVISDKDYLKLWGYTAKSACTAAELWRHVTMPLTTGNYPVAAYKPELDHILTRGCLARRIMRAVGETGDAARIRAVYRHLCDVLAKGALFDERAVHAG